MLKISHPNRDRASLQLSALQALVLRLLQWQFPSHNLPCSNASYRSNHSAFTSVRIGLDRCTNIRHISAIRHKAPLDCTFLPHGGHGGDFHWQGSASLFAFWVRLVVSPLVLIKPLPLTANQYGCRVELPGLTYPTGALGRRGAALKTNCPNLLHFPFPQDTFLAGSALKKAPS
jgi:hypothetical protein